MINNKNTSKEEKIFSFINPKDNTKLSELKGIDLQELLVLINDYKLELRDSLNLSPDITFGLELEFEHANIKKIDKKLNLYFPNKEWATASDGSLVNGAEISSPILKDTKLTWINLKKICSIISPFAKIGEKAGGHIHIGSQILGDNQQSWFNLMKIWSAYENIVFRFVYGEFLTYRPVLASYAYPLYDDFKIQYQDAKEQKLDLDKLIHNLSSRRNQAINFGNVSTSHLKENYPENTIEFRCPNGSLNPVIWQNNVNLLTKLLLYCGNNNFNNDVVEKRLQSNDDNYYVFDWEKVYNEIYIEQSLELCDMIFSNNLDKIYFLKQYLKQLKVCQNSEQYTKSPILTKVK